jgi:hypothetical protein
MVVLKELEIWREGKTKRKEKGKETLQLLRERVMGTKQREE